MVRSISLPGRRRFLARSAACLGASAAAFALLGLRASAAGAPRAPGYGELAPVADESTGLELLRLPAGFRYRSYGWAGEPLADGRPTPAAHDGMGVAQAEGSRLRLVRNHELATAGGSFAPAALTYDPRASGGATELTFDTAQQQWLASRVLLGGTSVNCAGGVTPWGTWLTCEETLVGPEHGDFARSHGWVFAVPSGAQEQEGTPRPLAGLGRFLHEALAVDPETGYLYETEDHTPSGLYRFIPERPGRLEAGGTLQMLKLKGLSRADLSHAPQGMTWDVEWVDIPDPERAHTPGRRDGHGVFAQGFVQGGAAFRRLEGCWHDAGRILFTSTSGGFTGDGQVWGHDPASDTLTLIFESPGKEVLHRPDNIAVSPRGTVLLCEDGGRRWFGGGNRLIGLTPQGAIFPFAENNVVLRGERHGLRGDFRGAELAGACFSPEGRWLFLNVYRPGFTVAIAGPWQAGPI